MDDNTAGQMLRRQVRRFYRCLLYRTSRELKKNDLRRSAVVFSPHFDDETLGCGGTIIRKKRAGAKVTIVFLTDGSKSHKDFMPENELMRVRAGEGIAAAQALGLDARDVTMLGFEETKLMAHIGPAANQVLELLEKQQPLDIFVPYHHDPQHDHMATNRVVNTALLKYYRQATVYEYPIWYWRQWPWVQAQRERRRRALKKGVLSGLQFFGDFRSRVHIADHLAGKRAALERHRSQMTRLNSSPHWPTLGDVSNGEFLECFFQDYELFSKRLFFPDRRASPVQVASAHRLEGAVRSC